MQITHPHTLLILAWLAIGQLCTGCSAEDIAGEAPSEMGVLCLQMSSGEDFVQVETRVGQPLNGFALTLKKSGQEVEFELNKSGQAIIEAGTYTLSATNSGAVDGGYGAPLYSGTSEAFTINAGETTNVTLDLGTPKNAKVTINLSDDFKQSAKDDAYTYEISNFALGGKTLNLTSNTQDFFFPVPEGGELTYILTAAAKQGSHVQDITDAGGTIDIAAGTHTTITLSISPIDDNLIIIENGEAPHTGEFQ